MSVAEPGVQADILGAALPRIHPDRARGRRRLRSSRKPMRSTAQPATGEIRGYHQAAQLPDGRVPAGTPVRVQRSRAARRRGQPRFGTRSAPPARPPRSRPAEECPRRHWRGPQAPSRRAAARATQAHPRALRAGVPGHQDRWSARRPRVGLAGALPCEPPAAAAAKRQSRHGHQRAARWAPPELCRRHPRSPAGYTRGTPAGHPRATLPPATRHCRPPPGAVGRWLRPWRARPPRRH